MAIFPRLNAVQIRALAELLLEIGKWLLLSVVLSSFLPDQVVSAGLKDVIVAAVWAFVLITIGIWMLKEVKGR